MPRYIIVLLLCLIPIVAMAHGWYPPDCCSGRDCLPIPCDQLVEQDNGNWLYNQLVFLKQNVKPSLDKFCHICMPNGVPGCAFVQMGY